MRLATFIDGGPKTKASTMMSRHSRSVTVDIAKEHMHYWEGFLKEYMEEVADPEGDGPGDSIYATDMSKPFPCVLSTGELFDMIDDMKDEHWIAPYYDEFKYMCEQDEAGMGWVYVLKGAEHG